ncbi:piRNA biogenesis protein EXD1, partial [Spinachia spinachia]
SSSSPRCHGSIRGDRVSSPQGGASGTERADCPCTPSGPTARGKRVKLTLKSSAYVGVVQRINLNKTLVLADVVDGSNGWHIPGSKLFFGHEIVDVEFSSDAKTDSGKIHHHQLEEHLNVETFQPHMKTISLDGDGDHEDYVNFTVIDEFHEKFGPADLLNGLQDTHLCGLYVKTHHQVMHIKGQHVIGVAADGVELFKHDRLCWLQIATKKKVYLFDILILGDRAFKNGLSMILENVHILKVIHDCRAIAGCLSAQFGVKLSNVFDTQVADVMGFSSKTGGLLPNRVSTLQEVLTLHLKVPPSQLSSLQIKSQLTKEEREILYKRPCPRTLLKVMALSVIHLLPLRMVLLDTLMIDYMALVDSYLKSSFYEPDELQHVNMESVFELPRELRQLEQMRQEWAADHYPVTKQGLLDRFNPRSPSPGQTFPAENGHQLVTALVDPPLVKTPSSPPRASDRLSVDGRATFDSSEPAAVPLNSSDPRKRTSVNAPVSLGAGRGSTEARMDITVEGSPFGRKHAPPPPPPRAFGRGFLLPLTQDQKSTQSIGGVKTPDRMGSPPFGHRL